MSDTYIDKGILKFYVNIYYIYVYNINTFVIWEGWHQDISLQKNFSSGKIIIY